MAELSYTATHTVHYNTKTPVPIEEVILALQALEGLMKDVPRVLEKLTDAKIASSEIFVENVQSGSLTETILVKLFFKDEEEFGKFLDKIRENGMIRNTIVGVALGAVVTAGVMYAAGLMKGPAGTTNITANNNTFINIGAGEVKMTPEAFQAMVGSAILNRNENARNAVKFLSPARTDPESSVQIDGGDMEPFEISPGSIAETPSKIDFPKNQKEERLDDVEVELRASDLDSKKKGWAGRIKDVTGRVKIELDPAVDESALFGKAKVVADITLLSAVKKGSNKFVPAVIYIHKIH